MFCAKESFWGENSLYSIPACVFVHFSNFFPLTLLPLNVFKFIYFLFLRPLKFCCILFIIYCPGIYNLLAAFMFFGIYHCLLFFMSLKSQLYYLLIFKIQGKWKGNRSLQKNKQRLKWWLGSLLSQALDKETLSLDYTALCQGLNKARLEKKTSWQPTEVPQRLRALDALKYFTRRRRSSI